MSARTDHGLRVVRIGLIGAGRIGTMHAANIARRVPGAELAAVADPAPGAAERLATPYDAAHCTDPAEVLKDPDIDAVVITSIAAVHTELVVAAAEAGKAVFCEKPMALTIEDADRAIEAARQAGVPLQIGFNRRFAKDFRAAHDVVVAGGIGTPQLLRSITRDPGWPAGLKDPGKVRPWTIFLETLIHDFDLLRWMNPGASPVEVFAKADALVAPDFKKHGLLDTAVVVVTFDNGAIATAEANFSALYGYDVRAEVFGSAGMVNAGALTQSAMTHHHADGLSQDTVRSDVEMFLDAYTAELASFVDCVRRQATPEVTGDDAREALELALAAIRSYQEHRPVEVA
jgi:myo-inositol 2-dehydrogenase/D-chiro-inositol 1-dehydrogenase